MKIDFEKISKELGFNETVTQVNYLLPVVKGKKMQSIINQDYESAANYRMIERDLLELEDIDLLEKLQENDNIK